MLKFFIVQTALHNAIKRMKTEIIDSADGNNVTHLYLATKSNSKKITNNLLSRGASVDDNGNLAVGKGNAEITELLLRKRANVNVNGRHGVTFLPIRTERGYLQIVKHLLKHRADVNSAHTTTTQQNHITLHLAVEKQHEQISKLLLSNGANVNAKRRHNTTSFLLATQWEYSRIVEQLLKYGTNVDASSLRVHISVYLAVQYEHEKFVKLFLECSASINSKDMNDKTILHLAVTKYGDSE